MFDHRINIQSVHGGFFIHLREKKHHQCYTFRLVLKRGIGTLDDPAITVVENL